MFKIKNGHYFSNKCDVRIICIWIECKMITSLQARNIRKPGMLGAVDCRAELKGKESYYQILRQDKTNK